MELPWNQVFETEANYAKKMGRKKPVHSYQILFCKKETLVQTILTLYRNGLRFRVKGERKLNVRIAEIGRNNRLVPIEKAAENIEQRFVKRKRAASRNMLGEWSMSWQSWATLCLLRLNLFS